MHERHGEEPDGSHFLVEYGDESVNQNREQAS